MNLHLPYCDSGFNALRVKYWMRHNCFLCHCYCGSGALLLYRRGTSDTVLSTIYIFAHRVARTPSRPNTHAPNLRLSTAQRRDLPSTSMTPLRLSPTAHVSDYVAVYQTEVSSLLEVSYAPGILTHERLVFMRPVDGVLMIWGAQEKPHCSIYLLLLW